MAQLSFIVCCHDSVPRLRPKLAHLAAQRLVSGHLTEVVIIDNASTDDTGAFTRQIWGELDTQTRLLVVRESRAGLAYARLSGLKTATSNIVCFVDDDSWLNLVRRC